MTWTREQVRFAHRLVDGGVNLVHGHSSHHPRSVEVNGGKVMGSGQHRAISCERARALLTIKKLRHHRATLAVLTPARVSITPSRPPAGTVMCS